MIAPGARPCNGDLKPDTKLDISHLQPLSSPGLDRV